MAAPPFLPESVWADFNAALNPLSGAKQPSKAEIRALMRWVLDSLDALGAATGTDPTVIANLRRDLDLLDERLDGFNDRFSEAPAFSIVSDVIIGEEIADHAIVDSAGLHRLALMRSGRLLIPGIFDITEHDPIYAGALNYSDGALGIGFPRSGAKPVIRGWSPLAGFPDVSHFVCFGQSNRGGAQALPVVTPVDPFQGNVRFVRGNQTWQGLRNPTTPALRGDAEFALVPHTEFDDGEMRGETGTAGLAAQLKTARCGGRFAAADLARSAPHCLFTNPTTGGKYLSELTATGAAGHWETMLDDVRRGMTTAQRGGLTYGVPAILFHQGEAENGAMNLGPGQPVLNRADLIAGYKAALATAFAGMDAQIRAITGQVRFIPMFLTQVAFELTGIAQAQLARENPNIFCDGPFYQYPSALNSVCSLATDPTASFYGDPIHRSADAQRWRGEVQGKVMRRVLVDGQDWAPLEPLDLVRVTDTLLQIRFRVPAGTLQLNTDILPKLKDYGFEVTLGTAASPGAGRTITRVEVVARDVVEIELSAATPVAAGAAAFVRYGVQSFVQAMPAALGSTQAGAAYPSGQASTEFVFPGDVLAPAANMLRFGAFQVAGPNGTFYVRDARLSGGNTLLRGETRDLNGSFSAGQAIDVKRDIGGGNLCDSDTTLAHFQFADASYGTRSGQYYPLNNFCLIFSEPLRTA